MKYLLILSVSFFLSCKSEIKTEVKSAVMLAPLEIYDFSGIEPYLSLAGSKTYIVNFWATWCAPCVKELPHFESIQENYKEDVEVILVSLDFPRQYESKLKPFIEKHQLKSKVIVLDDPDMNSWISKVDANWDGAIPVTLIYNTSKRSFYDRTFSYNELESELKTFLTNK
jgi:thiol-disulfide isomerase/thioredoxin|tara:strand:- start:3924 stop:4433 length:510 start_codon:yes stop_codon:yes gene_type:complete